MFCGKIFTQKRFYRVNRALFLSLSNAFEEPKFMPKISPKIFWSAPCFPKIVCGGQCGGSDLLWKIPITEPLFSRKASLTAIRLHFCICICLFCTLVYMCVVQGVRPLCSKLAFCVISLMILQMCSFEQQVQSFKIHMSCAFKLQNSLV